MSFDFLWIPGKEEPEDRDYSQNCCGEDTRILFSIGTCISKSSINWHHSSKHPKTNFPIVTGFSYINAVNLINLLFNLILKIILSSKSILVLLNADTIKVCSRWRKNLNICEKKYYTWMRPINFRCTIRLRTYCFPKQGKCNKMFT